MEVGETDVDRKTEKKPNKLQRPINLLNVLSKIIVKFANSRLVESVVERGGFHKHQFGFRRGKRSEPL